MDYTVRGRVIRGDGYGKKIGFPTLNLSRNAYHGGIPFGVYAGSVLLGGKVYKAGIIIGPKDKRGLPKLEAYLLGYKGDAYGKSVAMTLKKFLRKYKKFETEEELIAQIKKDIEMIK